MSLKFKAFGTLATQRHRVIQEENGVANEYGSAHDRELPFRSIFIKGMEWFGELGIFCARVFRAALAPPYELGELLRQCDAIGAKSLPLVALAGAATGVVLSLQTHDAFIRFGAKSLLPAVIALSIVKESGPVITGLVV